jgi:PKD repeat protein
LKKFGKSVIAAMVFLMITVILPTSNASIKLKIQNIPSIQDPSPGYWETSEYMIGKIAVGIILPESNGSIDVSTEDWTDFEIQQCLNKIQYSLDWWSSQNPNANVTFVTEVHARVPTSYELISHNFADVERAYAASEIMTYLGYPINYSNPKPYSKYQIQDYLNDLRKRLNTDWAFEIDIIDASNDADGKYADGIGANANAGGPHLQVPVKTTQDLDWRVAHEMAHIFWARDEYDGRTEYSGYLNASDIEGSGGIMQTPGSWSISGKPQGLQGTWGQIGWRDTNGNGIQDIVDTEPRVYLNQPEITDNRLNCSGVSAATPYPNKNPYTRNPQGKRDVTINKISVQFRVDSGNWTLATPTDGSFGGAIENFTFLTPSLNPGNHTLTIKAVDNWGNEGYTNQTVEIPRPHPVADFSCDPKVPWVNETVQFNASFSFSPNGNITSYQWNFGDNNITTVSTPIINHTYMNVGNHSVTLNVTDNQGLWNTTTKSIAITFRTDLNKDGTVNIMDIAIVARAYGSHGPDIPNPGDPPSSNWNAIADMDKNGWINIIDIATVAKDYGKSL